MTVAVSRATRAAAAAELQRSGLTVREIAAALGVSRSYAHALVTDPEGAADRARKDSYAGVCEDCGGPTDGSNGRAAAPRLCVGCTRRKLVVWSPERLVAAAREWRRRTGVWPRCADWRRRQTIDGYEYPCFSQCYRSGSGGGTNSLVRWTSWREFLIAAGADPGDAGRGRRCGRSLRRANAEREAA